MTTSAHARDSHADPSSPTSGAGVNVATHLPAMALSRPRALAVAAPCGRDAAGRTAYVHLTYAQLNQLSDCAAAGLREIGVTAGVRTVLMVTPGIEFFALVFALFKVGAVMVAVDPGMGLRNLKTCLDEAAPEAFIGVPKAHAARRMLGWAKRTLRVTVNVGRGSALLAGHGWSQVLRRGEELTAEQGLPGPLGAGGDDDAAILFTSGSTGVPKGVVYTHRHFDAQVRALKDAYAIEPGEVDLCTFPLFALYAPALGMSAVVPEMDFTRPARVDPLKIAGPIESFGVTNLFGSPALLNRLGRWTQAHGVTFPTLRRVISAGAPVPARVIRRIVEALPAGAQVHTPYGATESLPVCTIASDEILGQTREQTDAGAGVCVGRPAGDVELRVIRITDDPIPTWDDALLVADGAIGEIVVRGPVVTRTYFNREASTRLAKIDDPAGGFWHRMGDLGWRDDQGRVWFCGRKAHRVRTQAGELYSVPCEGIFNAHPDVLRTALVGVGEPGRQTPVLCVELEPGAPARLRDALPIELREIGRRFDITRDIEHILFHPGFPVDIRHNAKINREQLAQWATGRLR